MCANRQPTLGSFGFIKHVSHRGVWNEIILPDISEQPKLECPHCDDKFKNQQGLTVHLKCKHGNISESTNVEINNVPLTSSIAEIENVSNVDSEELQLGVSEAQDISIEPPAKRSRGQDSRRQYNSVFKAKIVSNLEAGVSPKVLAQKHTISKSMLSMWRLNKGKIMLAASNDHKKLLKIRPSTKYAELYRDLRKVFLEARSKGHRVDFNWIWSKAIILYRQKTNDPNAIVRKHVIVNFIKRNDLRLRSRQRNRKLSKENFRLPMQQWHATTRERLIRTGCADSYNSKWGRYAPEQRFNVDQSPCPFVINTKKTYEMLEKKNPNNREHKVWISQPGSDLDKRQCTLQICFRPTGKQPRVAIIFNGKGKRISEDEKNAWHPDVDVYFQENAWADTAFSVEWVKRTSPP